MTTKDNNKKPKHHKCRKIQVNNSKINHFSIFFTIFVIYYLIFMVIMKKSGEYVMKREKITQIMQILTVIFLLIAAFYLGRMSMGKELNVLFERVHQLEEIVNQIGY